jgi:hypothetical protein
MFDFGLSKQQLQVIYALSSGVNMTTAAEQAGVHPNTITYGRRNLLPFQQALASAQYDRALYFRDQAEQRAQRAFQTLDAILDDPNTPASVRLKAALAIINIAIAPPPPKKQVEVDIEKLVVKKTPHVVTEDELEPPPPAGKEDPISEKTHKESQPANAAPAPDAENDTKTHKEPQSVDPAPGLDAENPTKTHNESQKPQPIRRESPKIGRNEPCPCGSGMKYKRCCLTRDEAQAA